MALECRTRAPKPPPGPARTLRTRVMMARRSPTTARALIAGRALPGGSGTASEAEPAELTEDPPRLRDAIGPLTWPRGPRRDVLDRARSLAAPRPIDEDRYDDTLRFRERRWPQRWPQKPPRPCPYLAILPISRDFPAMPEEGLEPPTRGL
jgi:hypothetical protein